MHIYDLDTPALVVDLDVLERNIAAMARRCAEIGIPLRPHTKTHKNPEIAKMQMAAGACGIACQKLGDAEVMAKAGLRDILIPYNFVGIHKVRRLAALTQLATVTVALDSVDTALGISQQAKLDGVSVRVIVELDNGRQTLRRAITSGGAGTGSARYGSARPGVAGNYDLSQHVGGQTVHR
jgi:D-serine deaminase-like pyridoxal phosphate-dependent protein